MCGATRGSAASRSRAGRCVEPRPRCGAPSWPLLAHVDARASDPNLVGGAGDLLGAAARDDGGEERENDAVRGTRCGQPE